MDTPLAHAWEAGLMVVHPEDVPTIAAQRTVVCGRCDHTYQGEADLEAVCVPS